MKKTVISFVLFAASFSHADIGKIEAQFNKCNENAESTMEYNQCASDGIEAADTELNRVYNSIKTPLSKATDRDSKEILRRLVAAQRAWIPFRDADCELAGTQMLGGSGEGPVVGGCLFHKTVERVKALQEYQ